MYYREISVDRVHFGLPYGSDYTLAFSRLLYSQEVLVLFNISAAPRTNAVVVDVILHPAGSSMTYLYGGFGSIPVNQSPDGTAFVQVPLDPQGFAILS